MIRSPCLNKEYLLWYVARVCDRPARIRMSVVAMVLGSTLSLFGMMREQRTIAGTREQLEEIAARASENVGRPPEYLLPPLSPDVELVDRAQAALTKLSVIGKATGFSRFQLSDDGRTVDSREQRVTIDALGTYSQTKNFLATALNDEIRLAPVDVVIRTAAPGQISLRMVLAAKSQGPR